MADFTRRRWTRPRISGPRRPVDEEINPSSGWTNDFPGFHCLLVDLPGFEKDDIKLNFDESGIIEVSGRRKVDDEKQEHFKKTFNVPEDGDVKNGEMIFDGGTLRVRIPKAVKTETSKLSSADGASTNNLNAEENKDTNKPAIVPSASPASNNNETKKVMDDEQLVESKREANKSLASSNGTKGPQIEEANNKSLASSNGTKGPQIEEANNKNLASSNGTKGPQIEVANNKSLASSNGTKGPQIEEANNKSLASSNGTKGPQIEEANNKSLAPASDTNEQEPKHDNQKASVLGKIVENKGILLASIISFTLGVLLSHKMHPSPT